MTLNRPAPSNASRSSLQRREFLDELLHHPLPTVDWLTDLRSQARARLQELSIPTPRDEEWKYTDLSGLIQHQFQPAVDLPVDLTRLRTSIQSLIWPEAQNSCLVFVNGIYLESLSQTAALPDSVIIAPLSQLPKDRIPQIEPYLQQVGGNDVFTTLNTACLAEAAAIRVPSNIALESPLQILHLALPDPKTPRIVQPRVLVVADRGSSLTLIEDHRVLDGADRQDPTAQTDPQAPHLTNGVTEIWIEANAQVTHVRHQQEGSGTFHLAKTGIRQERDSRYHHQAVSLGAQLSRHTLEVTQVGESANTILDGLTLAAGEQLTDTHTTVDHQVPHGSSQQIHKLILTGAAHGVFNGKLQVRRAAQLTQASQSSRNLLLSPKARVDTKPQLEIFADDVKCAHGATVSQLEADELFYLQSRGVGVAQARALLTYGFAADVIDRLPLRSLQEHLRHRLLAFTQAPHQDL